MSEKQPTTEQNENFKDNVEVFGKEALSKENLASMHEKVLSLMNERDPEKKVQSRYDAAENLISLKQAGIKVDVSEKFATKMKNALPQIADKNPAALARYLNALKHLGAIDKDEIDPKYTKKIEDHIKERISSSPEDLKDETGKHTKGLAELCINMKGIGMKMPDEARQLLKNRLDHVIKNKETDALELSKLMVQVQYIEGGKSMGQQVDTAHANLAKRVESALNNYKEKGQWKEYAKLRAVYEMYKNEDGKRAFINAPSLLDDKTEQNLVGHTKVIASEGDINAVGSYVTHLRRIEEAEKLKRENAAENTETHDEDEPQNENAEINEEEPNNAVDQEMETSSVKEIIEVEYMELVEKEGRAIEIMMEKMLENTNSEEEVDSWHRARNTSRHERIQPKLHDIIKDIEGEIDSMPILKELASSIKKEIFEEQSSADNVSLQTPLVQLIKERGSKLKGKELEDVSRALDLATLYARDQFLSFKQNIKQIKEIVGAREDLTILNKYFNSYWDLDTDSELKVDIRYAIVIDRIREEINEKNRSKYPKYAEREEDLQQLLNSLCKIDALGLEKPLDGFDTEEFDYNEERPATNENESREFKELIKEGAERGRIMVYSSWPDQAAGKRSGRVGDQIVSDSRIKKTPEMSDVEIVFHNEVADGFNKIHGSEKRIMKEYNIPEFIRIEEPIVYRGNAYKHGEEKIFLSHYTGKVEDENEPVMEIMYDIRHTDDRSFTDYSGRDIRMRIGMVLPEKIAREIYKELEKDPKKIRQLVGEFDKRVVEAAEKSQETSGNKYDTRFLEQFNLPTKECDIFVFPDEEDDAMIKNDQGDVTGPNHKYIKKVEFKNNFE